MSRSRSFLAALLCAVLAVPLLAGGWPAAAAPNPTLVGITAAHHPGFDRIVFRFRGGLPAGRQVRYVAQLVSDAKGEPIPVPGRAILQVRFSPADAHDATGPTAPVARAFALPNIMKVQQAGDFEAVTTYGVGLAKRTSVHTFTLSGPSRVVIDIRAAFSTDRRSVYFLDRDRFVANRPPFFVPRARQVRTGTPAVGLMDRLFAGPVPAERADGLRLVRSGATGFTDLRISDGIARVQLTGGCDSGGSTVTIAGEIMPMLRQLASVRWVKIYGPAGHTERPNGRVDSIPTCLEP